jgi:hypothetical protein
VAAYALSKSHNACHSAQPSSNDTAGALHRKSLIFAHKYTLLHAFTEITQTPSYHTHSQTRTHLVSYEKNPFVCLLAFYLFSFLSRQFDSIRFNKFGMGWFFVRFVAQSKQVAKWRMAFYAWTEGQGCLGGRQNHCSCFPIG